MTNFDFLKKEEQFHTFSDTAITAERVFWIDAATCAINCRRAMEFAIKWLYSVDDNLVMPYQDRLVTLMSTREFEEIVGYSIRKRLKYIRELGNIAAHTPQKIKQSEAALALKNLHIFLNYIAYCYGSDSEFTEKPFDAELLKQARKKQISIQKPKVSEVDLQALLKENAALKEKLTQRRVAREDTYIEQPLEQSEYETRKRYIDIMLKSAGWEEGINWINEFPVDGMPNKSKKGRVDYVLLGDDGKPLALIEAKSMCKDPSAGRQQAKLYADALEKRYGKRPIIFLSNGFETYMCNDRYEQERFVSEIYSKRDLEKEFNKMEMRTELTHIHIKNEISDRYYQKDAIHAVCHAFDVERRRKALLVMATGSGKTRTCISIVDVLMRHGWVKNILFLADRNSLVTQAKRSFVNLMPNLSVTNLVEDKENYNARAVFSTYQTMMNCIDDANGKRIFTCGHFDLIIVDEAHRSIYNKYQDIFRYFDALLVGLTATPRGEVDKNTYEVFQLEVGVPTYAYELAQAVNDGFLVDFRTIETKLKFLEEGIHYDELSEKEKEEYEEKFIEEEGNLPENIRAEALNQWVFNKDTIKKMLNILMEKGLKVHYGSDIGKTIIFAKNHNHAEAIYRVWKEEFASYDPQYCAIIDNRVEYAQSLIDQFSDPNKMPQIAISVDMLDTGIDVPEILNLVFFKKVMSKAKFWQMIGRGTRLCKGILDGRDKELFYIFDFCNNFEFFRLGNWIEAAQTVSVQQRIFNLKADMILQLQKLEYQTDELQILRQEFVTELVGQVKRLNRYNFNVWQHIKYVDKFSKEENYQALTFEDTKEIEKEVAPLILPMEEEIGAVRFDALMYAIEAASLLGEPYNRGRTELMNRVMALSKVSNIPTVTARKDLMKQLLHTDYLKNAEIPQMEQIRQELREIMKFIPPKERKIVSTTLTDEIVDIKEFASELENDDLKNYKMKAEYYLKQHEDNQVIAKLKTNHPLTVQDLEELEKILWDEVGTKEEYQSEYGDKPLGELVREIIGLDMNAAKQAFSAYLDEVNMNPSQIYFVNQIVNYIVKNGMMKDFTVLLESPFNDRGNITEVFPDTQIWMKIRTVIDSINQNALYSENVV